MALIALVLYVVIFCLVGMQCIMTKLRENSYLKLVLSSIKFGFFWFSANILFHIASSLWVVWGLRFVDATETLDGKNTVDWYYTTQSQVFLIIAAWYFVTIFVSLRKMKHMIEFTFCISI
jgi:hypothetical protein